ncbi:MAG: oxygen-independent coproporphyrinogen III oxidase [Chitinophagales bacterium]
MKQDLLSKYNVPAPRYTSYPTVPYWQDSPPSQKEWINCVQNSFVENSEISLYIHLPYCESLCTYCGCNKRITKNHQVEQPYIESLLKEWQQYLAIFPQKPILKELHLGGGTPTFFQPTYLQYLIGEILKGVELSSTHHFSFEAHPSSTTFQHLTTLRACGFNRISIGVQDFDNEILQIINRQQTYEDVERVVIEARELGYDSINFDLIFGLPLQTPTHILSTFEKVNALRPDRIAFYSYAHVPWVSPSQRAYSEKDLPTGQAKRDLYELGKKLLEDSGYGEIGLDHFALPTDALYKAAKTEVLHRNFMGYTPFNTKLNLALGASSISDSWTAFVQNEKTIEAYQKRVELGEFPIVKGHLLHKEDQVLRQHILNLICNYQTDWLDENLQCDALYEGLERLKPMIEDGLLSTDDFQLKVNQIGKPFIRNICMALDSRYWAKQPNKQLFSNVV